MAEPAETPDLLENQMLANNSAAAGKAPETILAHLLQVGIDQETAVRMTEEAVRRAPTVRAYHEAHLKDANSDRWQDWLVGAAMIALIAAGVYFLS